MTTNEDNEISSLLKDNSFSVRVSSTLNNNAKEFGKQFMFDGSKETCWNSDQGKMQHVTIDFKRNVEIHQIKIMFQGGFIGKKCSILCIPPKQEGDESSQTKKLVKICDIYPKDNNELQVFNIDKKEASILRIMFTEPSDFYGRVIIYELDIIGKEINV